MVNTSNSDHTYELEADLQSLIRTVTLAPTTSSSEDNASPGLEECNKSWVDLSVQNVSSSSSDKSLGPLIGLPATLPTQDASDISSSSSDRLSSEINVSVMENHSFAISSRELSDKSIGSVREDGSSVAPSAEPAIEGEDGPVALVNSPIQMESADAERLIVKPDLTRDLDFVNRAEEPFKDLAMVEPTSLLLSPIREMPMTSLPSATDERATQGSDSAVKASDTAAQIMNRLKRLNSDARVNTLIQSTTPSIKRSRITFEATRPSVVERVPVMALTKPSPIKPVHHSPIALVPNEALASVPPPTDELLNPDPVLENDFRNLGENATHPPVPNAIENQLNEVAVDLEIEVEAKDTMSIHKKAKDLFPILQEIELLKVRIEDIRKQKDAKRLACSSQDGALNIPSEDDDQHIAVDRPIESTDIELPLHNAIKSEECDMVKESPLRDDCNPDSRGHLTLEEVSLSVDILNRLTYCRLRIFKPLLIEVEVILCDQYRIILTITLSYDDALTNVRKIASIHIDMVEKAGDRRIMEVARLFVAMILRNNELSAPLSNNSLDALRVAKDITPLLKKVRYY